MLKDLFRKQKRYITVRPGTVPEREEEKEPLWIKCPGCGEILYVRELEKGLKVCSKCRYHFRLSAPERIAATVDDNTFQELDGDLQAVDPLSFPAYRPKLSSAEQETGMRDAILTGQGTIEGWPVLIGALEPNFIMGSMGCIVGEKITRLIEKALKERLPVILFSASGGARMQEGVFSLMQMAKTSAAIARLHEAGILYVSVLTDPTTGGVLASFATLGDIILAEPGALIGFAGRRVTEQTLKEKLPPDFQTAEFCFNHGLIDLIVPRNEMRQILAQILSLHSERG
ncbi:MAG TPA: acetyl-CoA carboxylase carboxyltransferase subunit beta [Syntrophomonadaceae bacterium]|nr:acetyl-CoA carboxylase carboxyltransferase subunit beta [Syntrophomonadaceae bacterium]